MILKELALYYFLIPGSDLGIIITLYILYMLEYIQLNKG